MQFRIAALALACLVTASAQARTYAILSLVGDRPLLVGHEMSTGSRLDANERHFVDVATPDLDRAMLRAVEAALKTQSPGAEPVLLETRNPAVLAAQTRALETGGTGAEVVDAVRDIAVAAKASDLASGSVIAEEPVYAFTTTGKQSAVHPWDALTAPQKARG